MQLPNNCKIYIATQSVDMRKGINGLSIYVANHLELNPCDAGIFVFYGCDQKRLKILYWDVNGFALWYKVLDKGKFKMDGYLAKGRFDKKSEVSAQQLSWLLSGLDLKKVDGFKPVKYTEFY